MTNIVTRDPERLARELRRSVRQFPFALSLALNETAKRIQEFQREHHEKEYEIRRQLFWDRAIKIQPFSRRDSLVAVLRVDPPGGLQRASIVTRHQFGDPRRAIGGGMLAVPIRGGPFRTGAGVIRRNQRPKAFAFEKAYTSRTGTEIFHGNRRAFMVRTRDGSGFMARRVGRGAWGTLQGVRMMYYLTRQTPVPARMRFPENASMVFNREFEPEFMRAFRRAVETAR